MLPIRYTWGDDCGVNTHTYSVEVEWSSPDGTADYRSYPREHRLSSAAATTITASADPHFRGDPSLWNPEQLLVAAAANCHMLSYLALCALRGVTVVDYVDAATGTMVETPGAGGRFTEIALAPRVTVAPGADPDLALALHREAGEQCYIAASLNCPVRHAPAIIAG
ncbi:OsmC family peroxiredoxin [Tsukamurella conjunctivitidis]|uniref:OsmC family peroxiredoxin n=2 Tax=Tsukamurella TaxID=2060 RepID=A0A5C5RY46_9ACTN|nr:OsmC family peroxiredoxin [Tsukamurella columbiensis]TWS27135.1 OsmC family peroxiredoxin [Tsukamurella conjunctivitidis]